MEDIDEIRCGFIGFTLGVLFFALLIVLFSNDDAIKEFKSNAIDNGYAEYIINNEGNIEFQWIKNKE